MRVPPPPTRYPAPAGVQTKAAARAAVPPPVVRSGLAFAVAPALQAKKPNRKREAEKQLRKKMHVEVQSGSGTADKMHATASLGKQTYSSESGTASTESKALDDYILANPGWPWDGKTNYEGRPHRSCAEAHLYAKILQNGDNPKKFNLISYNAAGKVAPPCLNCKTWVGGAFATVKQLNASYRSASTRSPKWG